MAGGSHDVCVAWQSISVQSCGRKVRRTASQTGTGLYHRECGRQLGNGGLFSFKVMPWLGTKTAEKAGEEGVGTNHHQLQAGLSILEGTQKALKSIQGDSHH